LLIIAILFSVVSLMFNLSTDYEFVEVPSGSNKGNVGIVVEGTNIGGLNEGG